MILPHQSAQSDTQTTKMMRITRCRKRKCVDENVFSFKNILEKQDVKELMEFLEPLRTCGKVPAISFDGLKKRIDEFGGDGFFEKVADWSESTWNVPNPNGTEPYWLAKKVGMKRRERVEILSGSPAKRHHEILVSANVTEVRFSDGTIQKETVVVYKSADPGKNRQQLIGTLFFHLLKYLAEKCSSCGQSIQDLTSITDYAGWHMSHMHDKTCGPADCLLKPLKEAAEEYGKCILECAACHDQRTRIQYECNIPVNIEILGSVYGENIPIKNLSDTHEGLIAFRKKVDERDSNGKSIFSSTAKNPKISFTELDTLCKETIGIPIQEIVDWGEDKWITPSPKHKRGSTGNHRDKLVRGLEYAAIKLLSGFCAHCRRNISNTPPSQLSSLHLDHLPAYEKKFRPAHGVNKNITIAREEWDKCVCKHSACHIQGPKAHWRK